MSFSNDLKMDAEHAISSSYIQLERELLISSPDDFLLREKLIKDKNLMIIITCHSYTLYENEKTSWYSYSIKVKGAINIDEVRVFSPDDIKGIDLSSASVVHALISLYFLININKHLIDKILIIRTRGGNPSVIQSEKDLITEESPMYNYVSTMIRNFQKDNIKLLYLSTFCLYSNRQIHIDMKTACASYYSDMSEEICEELKCETYMPPYS